MKKRHLVILAGSVILVLGVATFLFLRARDPVYQGKRLSAWTQDLDGYAGPKMDNAKNAISHIGAEAVPYVIGLLKAKDSSFKLWLNKMLSKQSITKFRFAEADVLRKQGLFACEALGTNARPAIPALTTLMYDPQLSRHAAFVLVGFGPEITPILTNANTHPDPRIRWGSIASMARLNDPSTVPFLLRVIDDPDGQVRAFATEVLGYVAKDPDIAIPALLKALRDKDPRVQNAAAYRLELWVPYPQAKAATPLLVKLIRDTVNSTPSDLNGYYLHKNATRTLRKLDPAAAAEIEALK